MEAFVQLPSHTFRPSVCVSTPPGSPNLAPTPGLARTPYLPAPTPGMDTAPTPGGHYEQGYTPGNAATGTPGLTAPTPGMPSAYTPAFTPGHIYTPGTPGGHIAFRFCLFQSQLG